MPVRIGKFSSDWMWALAHLLENEQSRCSKTSSDKAWGDSGDGREKCDIGGRNAFFA